MTIPKRTKQESAHDVVYTLASPMHYRTKRKVLDHVAWNWTVHDGKYEGCRLWTPAAIEHFKQHGRKGLRHEHAVPRTLIIEALFAMDNPTQDAVFELLDRLAVGVVVTKDEQATLDKDYQTTMPAGFDSEWDPLLRFVACGLEVVEHPGLEE